MDIRLVVLQDTGNAAADSEMCAHKALQTGLCAQPKDDEEEL